MTWLSTSGKYVNPIYVAVTLDNVDILLFCELCVFMIS